jgi:hypothetical protein
MLINVVATTLRINLRLKFTSLMDKFVNNQSLHNCNINKSIIQPKKKKKKSIIQMIKISDKFRHSNEVGRRQALLPLNSIGSSIRVLIPESNEGEK